jgi:hypothetical protein
MLDPHGRAAEASGYALGDAVPPPDPDVEF